MRSNELLHAIKGASLLFILLIVVSGLITQVAALSPATARSTTSNGRVPFEARLSGSATFTSATTVDFHGTGQATHLGQFAGSGVAVLGPSTGTCSNGLPNVPNAHTETLTAANGDQLVILLVNVGCPTGPYTFRGTGNWTVVSGTGRFEDVTGGGTNEGNADFETNTFELALTGSLSNP